MDSDEEFYELEGSSIKAARESKLMQKMEEREQRQLKEAIELSKKEALAAAGDGPKEDVKMKEAVVASEPAVVASKPTIKL